MSWLESVFTASNGGGTRPFVLPGPANRITVPSAEASMVFGMRFLLSVSALLTLYVDVGLGTSPAYGTWAIFIAYALHSLVLLCIARSRSGFWHGIAIYWVDIGWYGLMIFASSTASGSFFPFLFFAILAASFRHGFDAGAKLTLGSTTVVTVAILCARETSDMHLLLLRATFVLALGYMIAFWGGLSVDQRRRLALLRDVSRLSNPRFGVQHTLESLMDKILRFYGGKTCVLLMQDGSGQWLLNTAHRPQAGRAIHRTLIDETSAQLLLGLKDDAAALYRSGERALIRGSAFAVVLRKGENAWKELDPAVCGSIADLLDTSCFISTALPLRKGSGRIFVTSDESLRRSDATFLSHIVHQAFPVIETIDLLDRLASEAAYRERQTIARDLHDTTIQPYIGLRHALAAIRSKVGDDDAATPDLDRLLTVCGDVIEDMRQFAQRFRSGRQEEPELLIALRRQLDQVRMFYDVDIALDAQIADRMNDRMAAEVFQIVSEGASNICKHTCARSARVVLVQDGNEITITIANPADQRGIPAPFTPQSIAERVHALGGALQVDVTEASTLLHIRIPT